MVHDTTTERHRSRHGYNYDVDKLLLSDGWVRATMLPTDVAFLDSTNTRGEVLEGILSVQKERGKTFDGRDIKSIKHPYGSTYYVVVENVDESCFLSASYFWTGKRLGYGVGNTSVNSQACRPASDATQLEAEMLGLLSRLSFRR